MDESTRQLLRDLSGKIFGSARPIKWRPKVLTSRTGDRPSGKRGEDGYDIVARQEYEPGDDPRTIDWASSAESDDGTLYTLQFQEPRDLPILILVDTGITMQFGTQELDKRVLSAMLAGFLIACAGETKDRVKVITYLQDRVASRIGPGAARNVFAQALSSILAPEEEDKRSSQSGFMQVLSGLPRKKSLVFIVSDFIALGEKSNQAVRKALVRAAAVHDIVCVVTRDRREFELPPGPGLYTLQDLRSGLRKTIWLTANNRQSFAENAQRSHTEILAFFKRLNCRVGVFNTDSGDAAIPSMIEFLSGHRSRRMP